MKRACSTSVSATNACRCGLRLTATLIVLLALSVAAGCGAKPTPNPAAVPATATGGPAVPANTTTGNPKTLSAPKLLRTIAQKGQVVRVAISADGRRLLSLEQSRAVRGWDVETGAELPLEAAQRFPELEIASTALGFDKESRFLIVPVRTEAVDENFGGFGGFGGSVQDVAAGEDPCALSADLNWMLAVHRDGRAVELHHVTSARRVRGYAAAESPVTQVCFSQSGGQFYAVLATGEILVRDLRTGMEVRRVSAVTNYQGSVPRVTFSPGRDTAHVLSADGTVRVWDMQQGKEAGQWQMKRLAGQLAGAAPLFVTGASMSANGRGLLATLSNGETVLVDATTGNELLAMAVPTGPQPTGAAMAFGGGMGGTGGAAVSPVINANSRRVVTSGNSGSEYSLLVWEIPEIATLVETGDRNPTGGSSVDLTFGTHPVSADTSVGAASPFQKARHAATEPPHRFSAIAIGRGGRRGWGAGAMPGDSGALVALHQFDTSTGTIEHSVPLANEAGATFTNLTVTRDEGRVAATTGEGAVVVIDTVARQVLSRVAPAGNASGSPDPVRSVSFSRDGKLMVVVHDTAATVHRTDSGDAVRRISLQEPQGRPVPAAAPGMAGTFGSSRHPQRPMNRFFSAALSSDAKKLTVLTADGGLMSHDMDTGKQTAEFQCQSPATAAFTADGHLLFVGSRDVSPSPTGQQPAVGFLYDVATGSQLASLHDADPDLIVGSDFSEDGNWLVTGHASGRCQRWSTQTGQKTGFSSLSDIDAGVISENAEPRSVMVDEFGGIPLVAGRSRPSPRAALQPDDSARALASLTVLDDPTQFWSVNSGGAMALWSVKRESSAAKAVFTETDAKLMAQRGMLGGIEGFAITLAVSPDTKRCLAATDQGDLILWDLQSLNIERLLKGAAPAVSSMLAFSPDSKGAAFATVHRGPLFLNLINFGLAVPGEKSVPSTKPASKPLSKSAKSGKSAKKTKRPASDDLTMPPVDGLPREEFMDAPAQTYAGGRVMSVAVYPDGKFLLCGHQDGSVTRLDRTSGATKPVGKRPGPVLKVEVSTNPQRLMAYDGESVMVWDSISGQVVHQMKVPTQGPGCLEFSADARLAVVWDERQREIVVLDVEKGVERSRIAFSKGEEGQLPFAISSDGRWLVAGSPSQRVTPVFAKEHPAAESEILDVRPQREIIGGRVPLGGNAPPQLIVKHFDPSAGSPDVKLWSLESGRVVAVLKGHTDAVVAVALAPDGHTAVTAGLDQTIRVWSLP